MRQRKRATWPVTVYRYWVQPEFDTWETLPAEVKQEAEAMRALWNQLVKAFEQRQASYRQLVSSPASQISAPASMSLARREIHQTFLTETQRLSKESPVTWSNKQLVVTQFLAALSRFFKKQSGPPHYQNDPIRAVHFHHRFTSGGLPIGGIFGRSHRLSLTPVPLDAFSASHSQRQQKRQARTSGAFQVGNISLGFRTILHRPLPPDAYVKSAALIGKQVIRSGYHQDKNGGHHTPSRWQWSLQLTLEIPPPAVPALPDTTSAAALLVASQLVENDRLRVVLLTDATGREEAFFLPDAILNAWQHKCHLQSQADQLITETKARLQHVHASTPLPSSVQAIFSQLSALRAPGLWRLLRTLDEIDVRGEIVEILREWATKTTKLWREARGLEHRYLGYRDWFYRNLAMQLCDRYHYLTLTVTNGAAETAHQQLVDATLPSDQGTYRHLAAPSRFITFLNQAVAKTGTTLQSDIRAAARG
ncbi:MAG: hypothetical protein AB7G75_23395 [Candidatus Binatia bacterium]